MSELQISLSMQTFKDGKQFAPEFTIIDRVAGSVLSDTYKCGGGDVIEWVVLSKHWQPSHVSTTDGTPVSQAAELGSESIRVMAWAELIKPSQHNAATDWRLFKRVMHEIEKAESEVPGLCLLKLAVHVDAQGRHAEPQEVTGNFHARPFVTFSFEDGSKTPVEPCTVLPGEDEETPLVRRQVTPLLDKSHAKGGAVMTGASSGAKHRIEAFFAKTISDVSIDVHAEGQLMTRIILDPACGWECTTHPQPTINDLVQSIETAAERNVKILHLAGHGRKECGFVWNADDSAKFEMEVEIEILADIVGWATGERGPIQCTVLNACSTKKLGQLLREAGVLHVVCWRKPVHDEIAREFCYQFYQALIQQSTEGRSQREY